jgi:hypothetical protein
MNTYDPQNGRWTTDAGRYEAMVQGRPAYRSLGDAVRDDPERAWPVLLELISEVPEDLLDFAGAGPLEEFVVRHAAVFADRIEARAREDGHFRLCLASVWLSADAIPEPIQRRLLDATDRRIVVFPREDLQDPSLARASSGNKRRR